MYKKILFLLLASLIASRGNGQITAETVSGTVLEAGTGKPVANASIYFDGTLSGTSTDKTGAFTLYPQANSKIPLIVSAIGYLPETITDYPAGKKLIIYLKAKAYDLDAVTITASDGMSRQEKLKIFRKEFLGTSANARSCEIVNESDIRLSYNKSTNTVKAFCDVPIIVHNRNLGYTFSFLLQSFSSSGKETSLFGPQFFTENINQADRLKIEEARQNAFLGSRMHFIKSLWNDELAKNGFKVYKNNSNIPLSYNDLVVTVGNQKQIHFKGPIDIVYSKKRVASGKVSSLYNPTERYISIDKDGYNDPVGITWSGVIGSQRAGDLLPLEYENTQVLSQPVDPSKGDGASANPSLSQTPAQSEIGSIVASMDTLHNRMPAEKLYIHFDKPYYSTGDTIWFKAYLFTADFLRASEGSGIVYLELANDTNKVLLQRMLPIQNGLANGSIVLNKEDVPEGSYTIRAYTNLMRNFGEDRVFKKNLYISGAAAQNWLVNFNPTLTPKAGKDSLQLAMQFNQFDKRALGMHEMELRVLEGRRTLFRDKVQTDVEGKLDVNFTLPEKADVKNVSIVVSDPRDPKHTMTIPIRVSRPENTDLQFMPEGGNLVAGIPSVIGFKAIREDGKGVELSGKVFRDGQEVAVFNSSYKGMGSFELTPKSGETYTAKVVLNGVEKSFPLPAVKVLGTAIRVINSPGSDSVEVVISSNLLVATVPASYYLIAQSRGIICYGAVIRFSENNSIRKKIAKNLFPTGITRFTLLSADHQPLNERISFMEHHDNLNITINPAKPAYTTRDSIALEIAVKDQQGNPVKGNFSMAVTDDSQVKTDSLGNNILIDLLLRSDLKGSIEDPGHYFQQTKQAATDLDLLMLTQGWVGYEWKDIFNPPVPQYQAESEFVVKGRVSNVFNKGTAGTPIRLLSVRPFMIIDTLTHKDGSFRFSGFPQTDSLAFIIQAKNKNDKSFNIGVEIDEFKSPAFNTGIQRFMPWYVNSDPSIVKYITTTLDQHREQLNLPPGTNMLDIVSITRKKIIKGSYNLNGEGGADIILDEADIKKEGSMSLYELLKKRFPSIEKKMIREGIFRYVLSKLTIYLVLDSEVPPYLGPLNLEGTDFYMNYFNAEDIRGIEIMSSNKFEMAYNKDIVSTKMWAKWDEAPMYIHITTRSGKGSFTRKIQGVDLYKPMPFASTKQFYSPRYSITDKADGKDQRSTIHWEPNIMTDNEGKAVISFYSADNPGTYSIMMEGSDMNGSIGRQTGTITIK